MTAVVRASPQVNLAALQEATAAAVPGRVAIAHGDETTTYAELTERTRRFASALVAAGVPRPQPRHSLPGWETGSGHVAIVSRNRREWLEAMYGSFKARVVPFNVNYRYTAPEAAEVLADAAPVAVVFESWLAPVIEAARHVLPRACLLLQLRDETTSGLLSGAEWYDDAMAGAAASVPADEWSPDDVYMVYTGGTTGRPKGVVWRQADIYLAAARGRRHKPQPTAEEEYAVVAAAAAGAPGRAVLPLPPFMHAAAQWLAMATLHGGDTLVIQEDVDRLDPADVWRTVARHRVESLLIVGDAFGRPLLAELERGSYDVSSLTTVLTGGAVTSRTLKEALLARLPKAVVADVAGSSESGSFLSQESTADGVATGRFRLGPGGVVVSGDRTRLLMPHEDEVGWLGRTGAIPLGYLHDEDKSKAAFPAVEGTRVSIPGDRAQWDGEGFVRLLGRDSVTINTGGEKVFAEEVEQALLSHPAVGDALAVGRPHERWGQEVVALVVAADGRSADDDELLAHCAAHLARFKLPKAFLRVPAIRRSPAGKPDYEWARQAAAGISTRPR